MSEASGRPSKPSARGLSWAALLIALAAFAVAVSNAATGHSGNRGKPRAYALVTGPSNVAEGFSHNVADKNVSVNNGAFCIRGLGFKPVHVEVTASSFATDFPHAFLHEKTACQGGTAVSFGSDLTYPEHFFIALW